MTSASCANSAVKSEYPTAGRWAFTVNRVVACGEQVVSQVSVTDGVQSAEPISFFAVRAGRIVNLVEYWPEPCAPPEHRRHLAEPMS